MKTDSNESPKIIVPLGHALKDARLAASFTIDEVADKLNLGARTVRDLEDNLENILDDEKYPIIYLRGYLANYAKLVGLSTLELFVEYQQLENENKQKASIKPANFIIPVTKKRSKVFPILLLLIIIIGAALYFLQSKTSTPQQVTPNVELSIEKNTDQQSLTLPASNTESVIDVDSSEADAPVTPSKATSSSQPTTNISENDSKNLEQKEVLVADENLQVNADINNDSDQVVEKIEPSVDVMSPTAETVTPHVLENEAEIETDTQEISTNLILAFNAECWTEVFDATGKRVAFGLYKNGRVLTLNGVAPFQLKLGDPSVVEIQYQDKIVAGEFTPGRSAQFSVPLS